VSLCAFVDDLLLLSPYAFQTAVSVGATMSHEDSRGLLVLKSVSSRDRDSDIPCRGFEYVQGYYRFDIFKADFKSIVAVHGLGGHREKSWTYEKDEERVLWLRDFLPIYVPDARIVTFGYSLEGDEILAAKIAEKAVELLDQVSSERTLDNVSYIIYPIVDKDIQDTTNSVFDVAEPFIDLHRPRHWWNDHQTSTCIIFLKFSPGFPRGLLVTHTDSYRPILFG
jgi:hypothetical protein